VKKPFRNDLKHEPQHGADQASVVFRSLLEGMTDFCFPPTCVFCQGPFDRRPHESGRSRELSASPGERSPYFQVSAENCGKDLCNACLKLFLHHAGESTCRHCGHVIPHLPRPITLPSGHNHSPEKRVAPAHSERESPLRPDICLECSKDPGHVQRVFVLGPYRKALREAVVACKRMGFLPLAANLGELLGLRIRDSFDAKSIGAVTYIPAHWTRRLRRGGIPTREICHRVASVIGVPVLPLLAMTRRTAKQGMLSDKERRRNVRGAFKVKKGYALRQRRILIVDDVWTTGSTLREAAEQLCQGYDAEILAAVVARAVGTHQG
jgi:predicted amidophosphoribosyltransferase